MVILWNSVTRMKYLLTLGNSIMFNQWSSPPLPPPPPPYNRVNMQIKTAWAFFPAQTISSPHTFLHTVSPSVICLFFLTPSDTSIRPSLCYFKICLTESNLSLLSAHLRFLHFYYYTQQTGLSLQLFLFLLPFQLNCKHPKGNIYVR